MLELITNYIIDNPIEAISAVFGIVCVYLNAKENIWGWPIGIINVAMAIYIFLQQRLYGDMGLHVIYVILGFYGWYNWLYGGKEHSELKVTWSSSSNLMLMLVIGVVGTVGLGYFLSNYTDADLPFWDSFTTVFSLIAQYQLTKKYLENWIVWIIVDLICVFLYFYKGIYIYSFLYVVYLALATMGFFNWKKSMQSDLAYK
ncbi:nicotinamide riboside transporter PnuC [Chondrinema litorale]|uniref:nicotinamide riboside transporter PnuC n=1 Tax=Chondrinema litorale TaxID=2994555 RepID=UPI0025440632|nr:nicotinamide riboside transporter PnuC [Chondrinema litorale]UZR93581.1 nicotinamide riboside transporter PnuC [Chondrinema litorale]